MRILSIGLIFSGYTLIYASTARGGKFATDPWLGLFMDAYDTPDPGAPSDVRAGASAATRAASSAIGDIQGSALGGGGGIAAAAQSAAAAIRQAAGRIAARITLPQTAQGFTG